LPGEVHAYVSGSELYRVSVRVATVPAARWTSLCEDCCGAIDSLVELLSGKLSRSVMERICQSRTGLFPAPAEIEMSCSCPDWATMCKHVAAVLYGIGARFDDQPELLFRLRQVDERELIARASAGLSLPKAAPRPTRALSEENLADLFGLELADGEARDQVMPDPPATQPKIPGRRVPRQSKPEATEPTARRKRQPRAQGSGRSAPTDLTRVVRNIQRLRAAIAALEGEE
jgi:uncharacterized Zn finger protein